MNAAQPLRTIADINADIESFIAAIPDPATLVCAVAEVPKYWRIEDEIRLEIFLLEIEKQSLEMGCIKSDTKE